MSRVLIDITRLFYRRLTGRRPTGVDRVGLEYIRHYRGDARVVITRGGFHSVLSQESSDAAFAGLIDPHADFGPVAARIAGSALLGCLGTPRVKNCILFNTGHMGLEHAGWARTLRRAGARPVLFVHDLIPISYPEYCRPGERERHVARMWNVLATGSGVIANSLETLYALQRFGEQLGVRCPPAIVAPLAPAALAQPGPRPLRRPYFVVLGTIEPRKNHWLLLHVWRQLVERMGESTPHLVVIGQRGWECENVVDLLERCMLLRGIVHEINQCTDEELSGYLRHAQALLMPSFAEGYGLPVAEALAAGVPVIASDLAVFHEIAGDVPEYVDPLDGPGWAQAVLNYSGNEGDSQHERTARVSKYRTPTWDEHFSIVDDFVNRLSAGG